MTVSFGWLVVGSRAWGDGKETMLLFVVGGFRVGVRNEA